MSFNVVSPTSLSELFQAIDSLQQSTFRFGAGYTDLLMEFKHNPPKDMTVINLAKLKEEVFNSIRSTIDHLEIGAMVTVGEISENTFIKNNFPVLHQAALSLASMQIREMATIGGNVCTASPAGDVACALVALNAVCLLADTQGVERSVPIRAFFTGVRKTALKQNELLKSIVIPHNSADQSLHSGFIKIGTRLSMECSIVSLGYHIQFSGDQTITKAGLAIGSVAPIIQYPQAAAEFLEGNKKNTLTDQEKKQFANLVGDCASPIDDIRASAWYRKKVLYNISMSIFEE